MARLLDELFRHAGSTVAAMQGLEVYPRNAELLAALAEAEMRAHTPSRLRRDLAAAAAAAPSPFTWLLALRCEALRAAATLRLQASCCCISADRIAFCQVAFSGLRCVGRTNAGHRG